VNQNTSLRPNDERLRLHIGMLGAQSLQEVIQENFLLRVTISNQGALRVTQKSKQKRWGSKVILWDGFDRERTKETEYGCCL
jgi:hypothetical protein